MRLGMRPLAAVVASVCFAATAYATPYIDTFGREWRPLNETVGLSWNQIATLCPTDGTTACSAGTLTGVSGTVDFTGGWTWASVAQVHVLFGELVPPFPASPVPGSYLENGSLWAQPAVMVLGATYSQADAEISWGWSTSEENPALAYTPFISDDKSPVSSDTVSTEVLNHKFAQSSALGAFLFRSPGTPVPEPTSLFLLAAGVVALGMLRRRRG